MARWLCENSRRGESPMPFYEYQCCRLRAPPRGTAEGLGPAAPEVPGLRPPVAEAPRLRTGLPPEGRRLVRDRLQERQGFAAEHRRGKGAGGGEARGEAGRQGGRRQGRGETGRKEGRRHGETRRAPEAEGGPAAGRPDGARRAARRGCHGRCPARNIARLVHAHTLLRRSRRIPGGPHHRGGRLGAPSP